MQHVVRIPKKPLSLDHFHDFGNSNLKILHRLAITFPKGDKHNGGERQPDAARIEEGVISPDDSNLLKRSNPSVTGGDTETDPLSQLGDRNSPIRLEFDKNFAIDRIHLGKPSNVSPYLARSQKHIPRQPF